MDYFIKTFFQIGGVFGLLFGGSLIVIFFLYKENRQLSKDKVDLVSQTVQLLNEARNSYANLSESASKTAENTYTIVQNLQQLLNNAKTSNL